MKPFSSRAFETALDVLLKSLRDENPEMEATIPDCTGSDTSSLSAVQLEAARSVITEAADMFSKMIASRTSSLAQNRNNLLPIHQVPAEVMTHILWYSSAGLPVDWSPDCSTTDYKVLQMLARTCKRWHDIIRLTPTLWSWIDLRDGISRIALENSRAGLIDVLVPYAIGHIRSETHFDRILPLAHRCRRLLLDDTFLGPIEIPLFHEPLTNLRTLSAITRQRPVVITLPKVAPVLTAIYSTNVIFRHNPYSTSPPSLSILHLAFSDSRALISTIEIIQNSPKLRHISLYFNSSQNISLLELNPTRLTELVGLKLRGPPKCVLSVLALIEVKAIETLAVMVSLQTPGDWKSCMDLLEGLPSRSVLPSTMLQLAQNGRPVFVKTWPGGLSPNQHTTTIGIDRMQGSLTSVGFSLRGRAERLWDTLRRKPWPLFPPNADVKIHWTPRPAPPDLPTIYTNFPNLLYAPLPLHMGIIKQLSTPDPATGNLPCPRLTSFVTSSSMPFSSLDKEMKQALKDLILARIENDPPVRILRKLSNPVGVEEFNYQDQQDLQ